MVRVGPVAPYGGQNSDSEWHGSLFAVHRGLNEAWTYVICRAVSAAQEVVEVYYFSPLGHYFLLWASGNEGADHIHSVYPDHRHSRVVCWQCYCNLFLGCSSEDFYYVELQDSYDVALKQNLSRDATSAVVSAIISHLRSCM